MTYCVAIPAYNAAETIEQTLQSVLSQTVPPSEIVVVDDGSTDETANIARSCGDHVRVHQQKNTGCGAAFTKAIRLTRGSIIASVDADDLWLPHKMETQLAVLDSIGPDAIVFAKHQMFYHAAPADTSGPTRLGLGRSDMIMTRAIFDAVGDVIDPPGGRGEMIDWIARAREQGVKCHNIDEVLVRRRIIRGSLSYGRDNTKDRGYLAVAYLAMQRRKASTEDSDQ